MQTEGRNPVFELLKSDQNIQKLYLQAHINQDTKINAILKRARKLGIKIKRTTKKKLDYLSKTANHQGVIAIYKKEKHTSIDDLLNKQTDKPIRAIYIREADHIHNIGAIIRSAECAGFDAVILPPKISVSSQIIRISMGAIHHITVTNGSLFSTIKKFREKNFSIIGIERSDSASPYYEIDLSGNILLIIGGENKGLSSKVLENCDHTSIIPQRGNVNSLNMSIAASITMFEAIRQATYNSKTKNV